MGALIMFGLVTVIAFVGGIYFVIQDRKEARHQEEQQEIVFYLLIYLAQSIDFSCLSRYKNNGDMKHSSLEIRAYGVGELAELYSPHMSRRGAIMQL